MNIELIQSEVRAIESHADAERIAATITAVESLTARAREIREQMLKSLKEWIEQNGDVTIGDRRYYVAAVRKTKCRDVRATLAKMLELTGGDLDAVADCLASGAWKHGAIAKQIPEAEYASLFAVEFESDVKTGAPKRAVQVIDERFVKETA